MYFHFVWKGGFRSAAPRMEPRQTLGRRGLLGLKREASGRVSEDD